ncbi:hypothetical protein [Undibacterium umbellatum]|uniref:SMODS and SLOG-associating 2TM effector domain-containing protein n=1 Tax=Undibacterium umbellatum TaxID=2762300 RepID=A0ABR6Z3R3_9BURK|nr:hypothetical protein [Undibacterium umbellatum]MBC3906191.1 hypothetical protein [Undibacterium umbellatum]
MEKQLWRAMLDSDLNSRYWTKVTEKYETRDYYVKLFLAIFASGTVAGWSVWEAYPVIWKFLSSCTAIVSIASPLLAYGKKVEVSANHAGLWADLRIRYADLWDTHLASPGNKSINSEYEKLRKIFLELEMKEPKLKIPKDQKIAVECQKEVLVAKNLVQKESV